MRKLVLFFVVLMIHSEDDSYCLSRHKMIDDNYVKVPECTYCQYSFFDDSTKKCNPVIPEPIKECVQYQKVGDKFECKDCQFNQFVDNASNVCKKCSPSNCLVCKSANVCQVCYKEAIPNIEMEKGEKKIKCVKIKDEKANEIKNCLVYSKDFVEGDGEINGCFICNAGFSFKDHTKKECVEGIPKCTILDPLDPKKCALCNSGCFIKDDGTCQKHDKVPIWWMIAIMIPPIISFVLKGLMSFNKKKGVIPDSKADEYKKV